MVKKFIYAMIIDEFPYDNDKLFNLDNSLNYKYSFYFHQIFTDLKFFYLLPLFNDEFI